MRVGLCDCSGKLVFAARQDTIQTEGKTKKKRDKAKGKAAQARGIYRRRHCQGNARQDEAETKKRTKPNNINNATRYNTHKKTRARQGTRDETAKKRFSEKTKQKHLSLACFTRTTNVRGCCIALLLDGAGVVVAMTRRRASGEGGRGREVYPWHSSP